MKKRIFTLSIIVFVIGLFFLSSCKNGEEDPAFSIYSRQHRLCKDWLFSDYKKIVQHFDTITSQEYNGSAYVEIKNDKSYYYDAEFSISFRKNGTYTWYQKISSDTTTYTRTEEGYWYFTGGGDDSDSKYKELLALQTSSLTESYNNSGDVQTNNYLATGNTKAQVYQIIKLSNDNVKLKSLVQKDEFHSSPTGEDFRIISTEMDLMRKL